MWSSGTAAHRATTSTCGPIGAISAGVFTPGGDSSPAAVHARPGQLVATRRSSHRTVPEPQAFVACLRALLKCPIKICKCNVNVRPVLLYVGTGTRAKLRLLETVL